MIEPDFLARSYAVLRPHVDTLRRNRSLRGIQSQRVLQWETGQPPADNGKMMLVSPRNDIADTLRGMAPHARRLLMELRHRKRYGDFPVMLGLRQPMPITPTDVFVLRPAGALSSALSSAQPTGLGLGALNPSGGILTP
jgi:hypothetical protein